MKQRFDTSAINLDRLMLRANELSKKGLGLTAPNPVVGAVIVDHQMQAGSAEVAKATAEKLVDLGLEPVEIKTVDVGTAGGPEAAARLARYGALDEAAARDVMRTMSNSFQAARAVSAARVSNASR